MSRAPGSGTRARSREIGYAEGVLEMSRAMRRSAELYRDIAKDQLSPEWSAAMSGAAEKMSELASYAYLVYELHAHEYGTFAGNIEHLAFLEREYNGRAARRELPQIDQIVNGDSL